ncbi:MAG: FixH family protein [Ignavibacteriales bacterium]|nr:FixH family protein [Ignavibacteriales bacterium]
MKVSWGVGITVSIIVFMLISVMFIYIAFNQDVNLVRDDYYEAEVKYNETMEKVKRTSALVDKLKISVIENNIQLQFPKISKSENIDGNILLYRPSERNKDLSITIRPDSNYLQTINTANMLSGMWKVKVDWTADSISYLNDDIIMVQ